MTGTRTKRSEPLRLIERKIELVRISDIDTIPKGLRGIYVLYSSADSGTSRSPHYNVVYVGMSSSGIKGRLRAHRKNKEDLWNFCSVFSVWPNVREDEIRELEGILRHIYRFDPAAQELSAHKTYSKLSRTPMIELNPSFRRETEFVIKDAADSR
ncbi:GIY-YIG nuclease family protein [Caballeronia sp. M23-90]